MLSISLAPSLSATPSSPIEHSETSAVKAERRQWTAGDLTSAIAALGSFRTADIAKALNVNPKALRSALRRHGVSLRSVREIAQRDKVKEPTGVVVRRSADAPLSIFGAEALADLPDGACRWPHGDPSEPDFSFCGARANRNQSYCALHKKHAHDKKHAHAPAAAQGQNPHRGPCA